MECELTKGKYYGIKMGGVQRRCIFADRNCGDWCPHFRIGYLDIPPYDRYVSITCAGGDTGYEITTGEHKQGKI